MSDIYTILEEAGYEPTIGLEVHVQLNTKTKIFSSDPNGINEEANTHVSAISLGLPGTLPLLNKEALLKAIQFGLAVGAKINPTIYFDRKSYFYPDLPKGYQTTQDKAPICIGGTVEAYSDQWKDEHVQLHHAHLEEDAGKSSHEDPSNTNIDLNRAGSPLIEIVTEPCIKSGQAAAAFLQEIRRIVRFLAISEANMEKGEFRCDTNISIKKKGSEDLGSKVEIKNMNSFNHVRRAVDFELKRQLELIKRGEEVAIETRTFNPENGQTSGMRFKETLNDYRYFPCPDLPPVNIDQEMIKKVRGQMNQTPVALRQQMRTLYKLPESDIAVLCADKEMALFSLEMLRECTHVKKVVNWLKGPIKAFLKEKALKISDIQRGVKDIVRVIDLELSGDLTFAAAQDVFNKMMVSDKKVEDIAKENGFLQSKDEGELERIVSEVLLSLPQEVDKYKKGKQQLFGLFMGEVMKKGGKGLNPKRIQEELRKALAV